MGPLPIETLLISQGKLFSDDARVQKYHSSFEESTKYSGLNSDLRIHLQLLKARAGDFLTEEQLEMLSGLAPKNQIEEREVLAKVLCTGVCVSEGSQPSFSLFRDTYARTCICHSAGTSNG